MAKYTETKMPEGNLEDAVLTALAAGNPYLFIVASDVADDPNDFNLRASTSLPDSVVVKRLLEKTLAAMPDADISSISDGFHTFGDLYEHRRALTALLASGAAAFGDAWRSKAHHPDDDPMFDGCFVVGIELPTGTISYHFKLEHWDDFAAVPEREHAPKWDGALPADTVTRCLELARMAATES